MKDCNCKEFVEYAKALDGIIGFAYTHNIQYPKGGQFKYCPWCGKKLEKDD